MILEYHRPKTLQEALKLLARSQPVTVPLAGGSALNRPSGDPVAAVDLQDLGLDTWEVKGNSLTLGPALTLHALLEISELPAALRQAAQREAAFNLRQVATVAGTLIAADGRSPFTTALLALDATLELKKLDVDADQTVREQSSLGNLLPRRAENLRGWLITRVDLPLNAGLAFESVARTPVDRPLVCAAAAVWPGGRTRLALGGWGSAPNLAMDGPESGGIDTAARSAYAEAGDEWASAEYRREMAAVLALRVLQEIKR